MVPASCSDLVHFILGESFRQLADAYLKKGLRKGVPPLFVDLKPLYKDPTNVAVIEELCLNYAKALKSEGSFDFGGPREPATAMLWVLYYLAQHYDYKKDYDKAFEMVNAAIEHTPTLIELFLLKGKLYKARMTAVYFEKQVYFFNSCGPLKILIPLRGFYLPLNIVPNYFMFCYSTREILKEQWKI